MPALVAKSEPCIFSSGPAFMSDSTLLKIIARIAAELKVRERQVSATVSLLDEGASVPFIARYRKEVTGDLDDTQLRNLEER